MKKVGFPLNVTSFVAILLLVAATAFSQPLARFSTPTNGATGTSLTPTITVVTKWKMDTSSFYYAMGGFDSLRLAKGQGVLVLSRYVIDSVADSLWVFMSKVKYATIINDTTLNITTSDLDVATDYTAIIYKLKVVDTLSDTLAVSDTIRVHFTTAYGAISILGSSVLNSGGMMRCGDTMRVYFNQPLDSANTPTGPLFELSLMVPDNPAIAPMDSTDTTGYHEFRDSTVGMTSWLDSSDHSIVCLRSSNLIPGEIYKFHEWVSRLTGDSSQNRIHPIVVRSSYSVHLSQIGIIGDTTYLNRSLFEPGRYALSYGDTGVWIAPPIADSFAFSYWSCPANSSINGSTNDTLRVTLGCSTLQDLNISAIYAPLHRDTIKVDSIPTAYYDSVAIYREDGNRIAIIGTTHSYPILRGNTVIIEAHAGTGRRFLNWSSNDGAINGSTNLAVPIIIGNNIWAIPRFGNIVAQPGCNLGGEVITTDPYLNLNTSQQAWITAPGSAWNGILMKAYYENPQPPGQMPCNNPAPNQPVTLTINPFTYLGSEYMPSANYFDVGLWKTYIDGAAQNPAPPPVQDIGSGKSINRDYSTLPAEIVYDVHRYDVHLQLSIAMSDGSEPPTSYGVFFNTQSNVDDGAAIFLTSTQDPSGITRHKWSSSPDVNSWDITFKTGVSISMVSAQSKSFEFVGWTTQTSTDGGTTWFASTDGGTSFGATPNTSANQNWGTTEMHGDWDPTNGHGTIIKAKAVFRKVFTLLKIAVDQDLGFTGSYTQNTYDADITGANPWASATAANNVGEREIWPLGVTVPNGGSTSVNTVQITFYFNDEVDPATINGMHITDLSERIDKKGRQGVLYFPSTPTVGDYFTLSSDHKSVTWNVISSPGYYKIDDVKRGFLTSSPLLKLEEFLLTTTTDLKSASGAPLSNPNRYVGQTVNPDIAWNVANTSITDIDDGWDWMFGTDEDNETYIVTSGVYTDLTGASGIPNSVTGNISSEHDQTNGSNYAFNTSIITITRPRDVSVIAGTVVTMDKDAGGVYSSINSGLSVIIDAGKKAQAKLLADLTEDAPDGTKKGLDRLRKENWETKSEAIAAAILQFGSYMFQNDDDIVGKNTWNGTKENWWGWHSSFVKALSNSSSSGNVTTTMGVTAN